MEPVEIIIAWQQPNRMYFLLHVTNQRAEVNFFNKPFFFFCQKKSMRSHKCEKTFNDLNNEMVNKVLYIHLSHCLVCPISSVHILNS